jgi:hypothetical protein
MSDQITGRDPITRTVVEQPGGFRVADRWDVIRRGDRWFVYDGAAPSLLQVGGPFGSADEAIHSLIGEPK